MRKNSSFAGHALRLIAAASLACTVATVGCSTDRNPGAGAPQRYTPTVGPTMPSSTPGSEQNRPVNPPMISSYSPAPGQVVLQRRVDTDALAIAAANQGYRGRYLGPADPGGLPSYVLNPQAATYQTGQFINPSDTANPEITVNSSISSPPTPVVTSGGGAAIVNGIATTAAIGGTSAITSGLITTPTTAAVSVTPTIAANTVATNATTSAAANAPAAVINNGGGLLTPTMSSGATVSPTRAANPVIANVRTSGTTTTATTTPANTTVRPSALTNATAVSSGKLVIGSGKLVIGRASNGTVTITNVGDRLVTTTQPVTTTPGLRLR